MLRDGGGLVRPAVTATVTGLTLAAADSAAVKLAQRYAAAIDDADSRAEALERLGPRLLAALESLGATPAARAKLKGGKEPGATEDPLQKLRAAPAARAKLKGGKEPGATEDPLQKLRAARRG